MTLPIAQLGQPVLRAIAAEVSDTRIASREFQTLLSEMLATLQETKGVGLAAPQVFQSERIFLAAALAPSREGDDLILETFINPLVTPLTHETDEAWEGCLSFAELMVLVARPIAVRVEYTNAAGQRRTIELEDFAARVVQHEYDHLNGILTIDRARSTHDIVKASEIEAVMEDRNGEEEEGN